MRGLLTALAIAPIEYALMASAFARIISGPGSSVPHFLAAAREARVTAAANTGQYMAVGGGGK